MRKPAFILFLFIVIIAFHASNNYAWLKEDGGSIQVDVVPHLQNQKAFYLGLRQVIFSEDISPLETLLHAVTFFSKFSTEVVNWPHLAYLVSSLFCIIFGFSLFVVKFSQIIWFIIMLVSIYLIGRKCLNEKAGALAAFILSMYPGIFGISRMYGLDFPLTAMTCLSMNLLLSTDYFENRIMSMLFGLALGLGILVKLQIVFFIIGPLSYGLYAAFVQRKGSSNKRKRFYNFAVSVFIAAIISSIWWISRIEGLMVTARETEIIIASQPNILPSGYVPSTAFDYKWILFYLFQTIVQVSAFFFLIFTIGLFSYSRSEKIRSKIVIFLWIAVPYIIFSIIALKWERYYFPSFPAFALISAAGILEMRCKIIKFILISLIAIVGLMQFFRLSYGIDSLPYISVRMPVTYIEWAFAPEKEP